MIINYKFSARRVAAVAPAGTMNVVSYGFQSLGAFVPPPKMMPLTDTIENMKNPVNCVLIGHQQPIGRAIGLDGIPSSMKGIFGE